MIHPPARCAPCRRACSPSWPWVTLSGRPGVAPGTTIVLCWAHAGHWLALLLGQGWSVAEWHTAWLDPQGELRDAVDSLRTAVR